MAGYYDYSMSNNAVDAYMSGEKPISKWTKAKILSAVEEIKPAIVPILKKVPTDVLKEKLLIISSWHHTSKFYKKTEFYSIAEEVVLELNADIISAWAGNSRQREKPKPTARRARCVYLVWSGTRKHPKATEEEANGLICGNWFFPDGSCNKKSITATGFHVLEYLD